MLENITETQMAFAFGKVLWGLKDMTRDELMASAKGFSKGFPFLSDLEAFCQAVIAGYAQAEAEYQQRRATLHE